MSPAKRAANAAPSQEGGSAGGTWVPSAQKKLILGIDPGLASTGYGLLDRGAAVVGFGCIRTAPGPIGARLVRIVDELRTLLAAHPVGEAALEELFMGRNRSSVIGVAQARGAILATLEGAGVRTFEYKPAQVKSLITGYGAADKAQIARMVAAQLKVAPALDDHAADAVAIGLCHLRSHRFLVHVNA
jgi:crossover junction endodeoxyribonuclease RuvC